MGVDRVMNMFLRIVFKLSMTFLLFSIIVLLWLRPEGSSVGMMGVVIGINAVTMLLSMLCLLLTAKKERKEEAHPSILDVLERKKEEETNE